MRYYEHEAPISPRTLDELLGQAAARAGSAELESLAVAFGRLPHVMRTDRAAVVERHRDKEVLRARLADLCRAHPEVATAIDAEIDAVNDDPDALDALLEPAELPARVLAHGAEELSYRRFFDIETLAGLRVEDEADVRRHPPADPRAGRRRLVDGLRVDHVDGLARPRGLPGRLREATSGAYVVVEKILERGEELPAVLAGGRDLRLRLPQPGRRAVRRAGNEAAMRACYARFTGLQQRLRGRGARGQAADHARGTGRRGRAADRPARRRLRAAPPSPRPHPPRAAGARCARSSRPSACTARTSAPGTRRRAPTWRRWPRRSPRLPARPDLDAELLHFIGDLITGPYPGEEETELRGAVRPAQRRR